MATGATALRWEDDPFIDFNYCNVIFFFFDNCKKTWQFQKMIHNKCACKPNICLCSITIYFRLLKLSKVGWRYFLLIISNYCLRQLLGLVILLVAGLSKRITGMSMEKYIKYFKYLTTQEILSFDHCSRQYSDVLMTKLLHTL